MLATAAPGGWSFYQGSGGPRSWALFNDLPLVGAALHQCAISRCSTVSYYTYVQYGRFFVEVDSGALTRRGAYAAAVAWVDRALERIPWFWKCPAHRDCTHAQIAGVRG